MLASDVYPSGRQDQASNPYYIVSLAAISWIRPISADKFRLLFDKANVRLMAIEV